MTAVGYLHLLLLLAGYLTVTSCGAAAQVCEPLETIIVPLPTIGTPFNTTISACKTVPAFVVVGVSDASFRPGLHPFFLPPQASAIVTSFTHKVAGWNVTEIIIATPLPGDFAPLSGLPPSATGSVAVTHSESHSHSWPYPAGTSSPSSSGSDSGPSGGGTGSSSPTSSPPPPFANTSSIPSLCPLYACDEPLLSASAKKITSLLNEVTLATQNLQFSFLDLDGGGGSSHRRKPSRTPKETLGPRFNILHLIILPLEHIASILSSSLSIVSAHPAAFAPGCDSDIIAAGVGTFVDAQEALLWGFLGKLDLFLAYGSDYRRGNSKTVEWRRDDVTETIGGKVVVTGEIAAAASSDDGESNEEIYVPFVGSLIRGALRLIKKETDELLVDLIEFLPARAECLRQERKALNNVFDEAIAALE